MGIASRIFGLALAAGGFFILWFGMGSPTDPLSYVYSFIGMIVMAFGFAFLTSGSKKEEKPPPPTVTEIRCNSCEFKEIRDFQKGDYVLKPVETTCPKCQSAMTIEGVYIVREEPDEKDRI